MKSLSVLMPTYNCEDFVKEAIESVLNQSFCDFEFLIVDDGSSDRTLSVVESYKDERIVLIRNEHNFVGSLNCGLSRAEGKYIARMDADDIMHPDRLQIQYSIMEECPQIDVCSSWMSGFGKGISKTVMSTLSGVIRFPLKIFLKHNFVYHPTVMLRKDFLNKFDLKYQPYEHAEDLKLWSEIAKQGGTFYVEPQSLLYYRVSEGQVTQKFHVMQMSTTARIKKEIIDYLISTLDLERDEINDLRSRMLAMTEKGLVSYPFYFDLFYELFSRLEERVTSK